MQCSCDDNSALVDISQTYTEFVAGKVTLENGDWVKLLQCPDCSQLWRTDGYDKYQTMYAYKLSVREGWKSTDMKSLIKERILENHGGVETSHCLAKDCKQAALKGRAYCVEHYYETGARA